MIFSKALEAVIAGKKISREGWNGKNMFVVYQKGYPEGISANKNTAEALGIEEGTTVRVVPYLAMWTAQKTLVPWVASQSDLLSSDWRIVE